MAAYDPDDEEAPLDPAAERLRRKLGRLLFVSGGIMMLGFIAVFAAIVYKLGVLGGDAPAPLAAVEGGPAELVEASISLPPGSSLVAADIDGARALLQIQSPDGGASLLLVDLATGKILGRYALRPE